MVAYRAEYEAIAQKYQQSKKLSFRKYVEEHTLFSMARNLNGKVILDLACGEGHYTRKLKRAGAKQVLGVDLSSEMIELAEQNEWDRFTGCRYLVHDVAKLPVLGKFDIVTAMYLLNYARTREELVAFCRAAYKQLTPGGRFLGMNDNPANHPRYYHSYINYGFVKYCNMDRQEGDAIRYTFFNDDGSRFHFNNYYLSTSTYESVFEEVGFSNFTWEGPYLAPSQQHNSFWADLMEQPPIIGFSAQKPIA